jgi:glycerol-3-phosphate acyltransferase PlsY
MITTIWLAALVVALVGYFLGSIPSGVIAGRVAGIDLRKHGSGNIGATNAFRVLGKKYGSAVFAADVLKGWLAVQVSHFVAASVATAADLWQIFAVTAAVAVILGHSFPIWLRFKGGKGVATSAGAVFGLMPIACLLVGSFWVVLLLTTRYVSLASVLAALGLSPIVYTLLWIRHEDPNNIVLWFSIVMALVVVWRHRSNLIRLYNGTEPRFQRRK